MLYFLQRILRRTRPTIMEPLIAVVGATGTGKSKVRNILDCGLAFLFQR